MAWGRYCTVINVITKQVDTQVKATWIHTKPPTPKKNHFCVTNVSFQAAQRSLWKDTCRGTIRQHQNICVMDVIISPLTEATLQRTELWNMAQWFSLVHCVTTTPNLRGVWGNTQKNTQHLQGEFFNWSRPKVLRRRQNPQQKSESLLCVPFFVKWRKRFTLDLFYSMWYLVCRKTM